LADKRVFEIATLGLLHGILHIYQSALPPLYLLLQEEFEISTLQLGLLGSVMSLTNIFQGATGYLAVKIGRKKLTVIGMLLYSLAVYLFGLSSSFPFLLMLVALAGLGGSTFHPATYSMITERAPREHITKSVAYHQFGGFLGGAVGVALVGSLALILGWRNAVQILVIPGLFVITLFLFVIKEGKGSESNETEKIRLVGQEQFTITPPLLVILLAAFIGALGGGMGRFLPLFLSLEYGESVAWAGVLTGIMQGVGCVSLIIGGLISDKFDKVLIVSSFTFLTGISTIILATGHFSSFSLLFVLVFRGFAQYFAGPARRALTAIISKTSPKGIGLEFAFISLGGILGAPLTGHLIDTVGIRSAFLILTIFTFFSGVTILLLKKWSSSYTIRVNT
jgi:MFS family permease